MPSVVLRQMNSLDERGSYRQQRKRRAGISGECVATGTNPTTLSRSPQSSIDSNTDVAQISMNWMRMNGLGQGAIRPLLTGNRVMAKHGGSNLVASLRNGRRLVEARPLTQFRNSPRIDLNDDRRLAICPSLELVAVESEEFPTPMD
ncbi:unnamed protein product [Angiostrongylus costaricensis]|uniref:DNA-directed RNA polymerase n=1 Tax=Angiostrongylus costaricensis TaxID=334426 RepID=A0A158PGI8_ANGCS|nr:unnamed protein product [Angiostrongylus costaricensis]